MKLTFVFFLMVFFSLSLKCHAENSITLEQISTCKAGHHTKGINYICLTPQTLNIKNLFLADDINNIVVVENTSALNFTSKEILETFADKKFNLLISGVCAGNCSRLLLPLAESVTINENAIVVLNDSSLETRSYNLGKKILNSKYKAGNGIMSLEQYRKTQSNYNNKFKNDYYTDLKIIKKSKVNITHLTWHSYVRQTLKVSSNKFCKSINSLNIILTPDYFYENNIIYNKNYKLPQRKQIIELLNNELDDPMIIYSYEDKPFNGCK